MRYVAHDRTDPVAAGDRAVVVHGASAEQALLQAGQLDELALHLVPVLLGAGRRLFEDQTATTLSGSWSDDSTEHLRYRVRRQGRP
jgi:dihydrofolate reductase